MCCFLCFLNACFRFHNRWQSLSDTSWAHQVCRVGNRKATTKMSFAKHHGSYLSHTKLWNAFPLSPTHIVYTHLYSSPHTWLYSSFPASAGSLSLWLWWSAQTEQVQQSDSTPTHKAASISCLQVPYRSCVVWKCQLTSHVDGHCLSSCLWSVSLPRLLPQEAKPHLAEKLVVEALRCLGVQRGNGIERQRKKGLPHSSTFTPCCCCCCCWLPLLSLHLPSPPHQDGPVSPWRGNQTCRQQRSTKG